MPLQYMPSHLTNPSYTVHGTCRVCSIQTTNQPAPVLKTFLATSILTTYQLLPYHSDMPFRTDPSLEPVQTTLLTSSAQQTILTQPVLETIHSASNRPTHQSEPTLTTHRTTSYLASPLDNPARHA